MKAKDCRVTGCTNGECRKCKRNRAARRERGLNHNERDLMRMLEKHGMLAEVTEQAEALVCQAMAQLGRQDALGRAGFDTASSASVQHFIDTGRYLHHGEAFEMVEWF